jgi:uncharacterized protein YqeY
MALLRCSRLHHERHLGTLKKGIRQRTESLQVFERSDEITD